MANSDEGNYAKRVLKPIELVTGELVGQSLLKSFRARMLKERVFRTMFGEGDNARLFFNNLPSYNDSILPCFELYWKEETFTNYDVWMEFTLDGRFVLPAMLKGEFDRFRLVAAVFERFISSLGADFYSENPGLLKFANGIRFQFDRLLAVNGIVVPVIPFTLPVTYDLHEYYKANDEIDLAAALDADAIQWGGTYELNLQDENQNELIPTGVLVQTEAPVNG